MIEYQPSPAPYKPEELPRYIEDELRRIADLKEPRFESEIFGLSINDTITIVDAVVPTWIRLIEAGDVADFAFPDLFYDQSTGRVTALSGGAYLVSVVLNTHNVGGAGNRDYFLAVALQVDWDGVSAPAEWVQNQKLNSRDMVVSVSAIIPVQAGQTIDPLGAAWADQFTIVSDIDLFISILRVE